MRELLPYAAAPEAEAGPDRCIARSWSACWAPSDVYECCREVADCSRFSLHVYDDTQLCSQVRQQTHTASRLNVAAASTQVPGVPAPSNPRPTSGLTRRPLLQGCCSPGRCCCSSAAPGTRPRPRW